MKTILVLLALVALVACRPETETYDTRHDDINPHEIASSIRLLTSYLKCLTSKGPCTSEGTYFKKNMSEAVKTNCAKCTDKQVEIIRVVGNAMKKELPELWGELVKQEDPNGEYTERFETFLKGSN